MKRTKKLTLLQTIVKKLSREKIISERVINQVVMHQFNSANEALKNNNTVEISGFGKFTFNSKKAYKRLEKLKKFKKGYEEGIEKGVYKGKFELPDGIYAIGLYVDSNNNEQLDTNFFGIPTEQFGFSNNAKGRFGPPLFESASFELDALKEISINLK